jgi:hypothetical protein
VEVLAILDTGCELTIMNEDLYERIQRAGNNYLELPTQHLILVSALNDKGRSKATGQSKWSSFKSNNVHSCKNAKKGIIDTIL